MVIQNTSLSFYICLSSKLKNTYLLIPFSRVHLEKLTCFQPVKKFPAFYGTRRFTNTFMSGFGGLEVACWPLVPKFAGSNPAEAVRFLRGK